ncbi:mevalonate kinase [Occultella aeris]|uniref:Mevalonate kinase n=1 Tax=Occultella aeris TaxID=2761496 RepID=A0A7M4DQD4_9MICO|nr:mevalonate kinase [Occultella aeris]
MVASTPLVGAGRDGDVEDAGRLAPVATGTAHAKAILIGEHAVVYGHPAIALPLIPLRTIARLRTVPGPLSARHGDQRVRVEDLPEAFAPVGVAVTAALAHFGLPGDDLEIELDSDIPPGAGLGASAASAHAIVEAVRVHAGQDLDEEARFELVQTAERVAHGNPSGLDARATRARTPVAFTGGVTSDLHLGGSFSFAVADTGVRSPTRDAVAGVRRFVEAEPDRGSELLERLAELTRAAGRDLGAGRTADLGARLDAAQEALDALGVGHPAIDRLLAAARAAGATGAKLTGAGRGGCVIAVADSPERAAEIVTAMQDAGAVGGWVVTAAGR